MKTCNYCKQTKPLTDYPLDRRAPGGIQHTCRPCRSAYVAATRQDRKDGIPAMTSREKFVHDYTFFRSQGLTNDQARRRIGLGEHRFLENLIRFDCRVLSPLEQACWDRIMLCIERGKPFTVEDMPIAPSDNDFQVVVNILKRRGLVRVVDSRYDHPLGQTGKTVVRFEGVGCEARLAG